MLEFSSNGSQLPSGNLMEDPGVDEGAVADAIEVARGAELPVIEGLERIRRRCSEEAEAKASEGDDALMTDEEVVRLLGLESPMATTINNQPGN